MLALGSWRDRVAAQLRPHDIALNWKITPPGLPVHPELRPAHVIQIVRLLDEAVTNAAKHAGAKNITVSIATLTDASGPYGCIAVEDDGRGFTAASNGGSERTAGRGLRNMQNRAARCGASCEVVSGATGTRVRLTLPHRFPGDAGVG
jgi:signal transduction histidine kinase